MKIILDGQIMFSIGIISKMMMYFLMDVMIGKKEKRVGIVLLCVAHFLIYNVGILIVMDRLFGKEQWFQLLMPTCSLFLATGSVAAFSLLTKNSFFKMLLECVVADAICGVIIYIDRELFSDPLSLFIFAAVVFAVFYVVSRPLLKKCRTLQMGHSWIVGGFLLIALINSWFSNILYVLEKEKMLANSMQLVSFLQIVIVLFAVLMECIIYYLVLKRKYKMLLRRNEQMESYYRQAAKHIRDMETGWDFLGGGSADRVFFIEHNDISEKRGFTSGDVSEQTKRYLQKLKRQYKAANEIFFCNDFAVDSVLREFVLECHSRNIHTDISFYEYDRKKADPEDVAAILSRMLDFVLKIQKDLNTEDGGRARVQGAVVKNQLIFSVTFTIMGNTELPVIKIRKKDFNPWIKKYDGLIQLVQKENSLQIIVGLNE